MDYAIGGFGTGEGLASQGSLQRSSDGRYLLAVDAGSNQISVLRIKSDGSLKRVGRRLVSSSGVNPVSIAVRGHLVNVANAGTATSSGGTNYTGFTLNPGSHLRPLAGSTVGLPDASQPGDVLLSPDGRKLVGTRVATAVIDSFTVQRDRRLTAAPGSPFAAQGLDRPVRQPVPPHQRGAALRHQWSPEPLAFAIAEKESHPALLRIVPGESAYRPPATVVLHGLRLRATKTRGR